MPFSGNTYRVSYTVWFKQENWVVLAWMKKSPRKSVTPPGRLEKIEQRVKRLIGERTGRK